MSISAALQIVFWLSSAGVLFTFLGYPLLIRLLAELFPCGPGGEKSAGLPGVCAVVVAFNEEQRIVARIENLLASGYEKLTVLVVSDGSTDSTAAKIATLNHPRVQCLARKIRSGKAACLNAAVAQVAAEIIVFTDARQRFAADTIQKLAAHFSDPKVGAVSGALVIDPSKSSVGEGVDAYWKLEKIIRAAESRFGSCIGCTGAVYAIRRGLFEPLPEDTILDDVVIPMRIALRNYRVLFDADAVAFDPQPLEPAAEKIRKKRTLAGNFQMLFRHPGWLLPWRNRLWWQLIAHKYLRIVSPALLVLAFASNTLLAARPVYLGLLGLQCLFYFLAMIGMALPSLKSPAISWPAGFVFLNTMTLRGFACYLQKGGQRGEWESHRPM
jgi:cellulose synthase/poly-beta-1,6-N-acetylglucosamine synthase-like glycosyltransferase